MDVELKRRFVEIGFDLELRAWSYQYGLSVDGILRRDLFDLRVFEVVIGWTQVVEVGQLEDWDFNAVCEAGQLVRLFVRYFDSYADFDYARFASFEAQSKRGVEDGVVIALLGADTVLLEQWVVQWTDLFVIDLIKSGKNKD